MPFRDKNLPIDLLLSSSKLHILYLYTNKKMDLLEFLPEGVNVHYFDSRQDLEELFHEDKREKYDIVVHDPSLAAPKDEGAEAIKGAGWREYFLGENFSLENLFEIEKTLNKLNTRVICMYNLLAVFGGELKKLVKFHDLTILDTGGSYLVTYHSPSLDELSPQVHEEFVKTHLDLVILSLISRKMACGKEIQAWIHDNLGVLVSPGRIYPLLHRFEDNGLLKSEKIGRSKFYKVTNEAKVRKKIEQEATSVNSLFKFFLRLSE